MKFDPVFETVAVADDVEPLKDFTNSVHIMALKTNTSIKENILVAITIWNQINMLLISNSKSYILHFYKWMLLTNQ